MSARTRRGSTLLIIMIIMIAIGLMVTAITATTVIESRNAQSAAIDSRSSAATDNGLRIAQQLVMADFSADVKAAVESTSGANFSAPRYVASAEALRAAVQSRVDTQLCGAAGVPPTLTQGSTTISVRVHFTAVACGTALPAGAGLPAGDFVRGRIGGLQLYRLPFVIVTRASDNGVVYETAQNGEYTIKMGPQAVSAYAMFYDDQINAAGTTSYLNQDVQVDGPVHINGVAYLEGHPYFGQEFTSGGCSAPGACSAPKVALRTVGTLAYRDLRPSLSAPCYATDCPIYAAGAAFGAPEMTFSTSGVAGAMGASPAVLNLSGDVTRLQTWFGPPNSVAGDPATDPTWTPGGTPTGSDRSTYRRYLRACTTDASDTAHSGCNTYEYVPGSTSVTVTCRTSFTPCSGATAGSQRSMTVPTTGLSGIYITGNVLSLGNPTEAYAAIQAGSGLTIAASGTITITGSMRYENPPCSTHMFVRVRTSSGALLPLDQYEVHAADCQDADVVGNGSVLGYIALGSGGIQISNPVATQAQPNLTIHGALWAPNGTITLNSNSAGQYVNILGAMAARDYTAFGRTQSGDYKLRFDYDPRLGISDRPTRNAGSDLIPPFFPIRPAGVVSMTVTTTPPKQLGRAQVDASGTGQ